MEVGSGSMVRVTIRGAIALLMLLLPLLLGCGTAAAPLGDGTTNGGSQTDGGTTPAELQQTSATAQGVSQRFREICGEGDWDTAAAESFVTYAEGIAGVADARLHETTGDVTVEYSSGVHHVFHTPHDEGSLDDLEPFETEAAATPRDMPHPTGAPTAIAAHSLTPAEQGVSWVNGACGSILRSARVAGYNTPDTNTTADVEWFRQWDEHSLVFFEGHGGYALIAAADGNFDNIVALQTTVTFVAADGPPAAYAADIAADRLIFFSTDTAGTDVLAVTPSFFEHYCSWMVDNSIVYLNSCFSLNSPELLATTFQGLGCQLVVGWDGPGPMAHAARWGAYFIDRLLGSDEIEDKTPPNRPFVVSDVFDRMIERDRVVHVFRSGDIGVLSYYPPETSDPRSARPIIHDGVVVPPRSRTSGFSKLFLGGYFGPTRGRVFIDDAPIVVLDWTSTILTCELPDSGAAYAGDVIVRVGELESNPVLLCSFEGDCTVDIESPGQYDGFIDFDIIGRGIVKYLRDEVDGTPGNSVASPRTYWVMIETGQMNWDISGEWSDLEGSYAVDAHGTVYAPTSDSDAGGLLWSLDFDLVAGTYQLMILADVSGTFKATPVGGSSVEGPWIFGAVTPGYLPPEELNEGLVIPQGTYSGVAGPANYTIEWSNIRPYPSAADWEAYPSSVAKATE